MAAAVYGALAGLQLLYGLNQADMIRQQAALQREIDTLNIRAAEIDAFDAEADGMTQEARYQSVIDAVAGEQATMFAAQDIDSDYGTARVIGETSRQNGLLNSLDIRNAAHAKASGFKREARATALQSEMSAAQAELNATATTQAAVVNAISTGVSGYAKTGSSPKKPGNVQVPQLSRELRLGAEDSYLVGESGGPGLGYLGTQR